MVFHQPVAEFLMNCGVLLAKAVRSCFVWFIILILETRYTTQHEHRRNGVTIGEVGEEVILDAIRRCG